MDQTKSLPYFECRWINRWRIVFPLFARWQAYDGSLAFKPGVQNDESLWYFHIRLLTRAALTILYTMVILGGVNAAIASVDFLFGIKIYDLCAEIFAWELPQGMVASLVLSFAAFGIV